MRNIGLEMRNKRNELGYTMQEVADYVGVSKSSVAKWESGYIDNIKRDKIDKLSQILKVSPMFFVSEDYDENAEEKKIYYLDDETAQYAQEIANNKDLKMLFDAAKDIKKEDMKFVYEMIKRFKNDN